MLGWPAGTWLIGIVGAGFVGVGLFQGYRAWSADFLEDAKTEEMGAAVRRAYEWVARFGYVARMIVFGLIGILLVVAAAEYDPNKAVGLDGALAKLAHTSYGPYLLGVVAAGLISFGVYSLEDARYRRL